MEVAGLILPVFAVIITGSQVLWATFRGAYQRA